MAEKDQALKKLEQENSDLASPNTRSADTRKDQFCCTPMDKGLGCCCKVESVVSVDDRGQMVLPKEMRDKAKIHAGDKLAVISWEKEGEVCCISLIKVEGLAEMVKDMLGPLMKEILQQ